MPKEYTHLQELLRANYKEGLVSEMEGISLFACVEFITTGLSNEIRSTFIKRYGTKVWDELIHLSK